MRLYNFKYILAGTDMTSSQLVNRFQELRGETVSTKPLLDEVMKLFLGKKKPYCYAIPLVDRM